MTAPAHAVPYLAIRLYRTTILSSFTSVEFLKGNINKKPFKNGMFPLVFNGRFVNGHFVRERLRKGD